MDAERTCFVVGDGAIAVRCCELLLEHGFIIRGVLSQGEGSGSWAKERKIKSERAGAAAFHGLAREPFDFLFSIFNVHVLPAWVIALPRRLAINYHDALLPRFAGLYAPTWSVLHGEREHGVTWHVMTEEVDAGDILKQGRFPISSSDSALRVNQLCFEAAMSTFGELLRELLNETAARVPQDLRDRTYFAGDARPYAACIIDWRQSAEKIMALVRALDLGPFRNPIGLPKICLSTGRFICVTQVERSTFGHDETPGTVLRIDDGSIVVAVRSASLVFSGITTAAGEPVSAKELTSRFGLKLDQVLPSLATQAAERIHESNRRICRQEAFWSRRLEDLRDYPFVVSQDFGACEPSPRSVVPWKLPPGVFALADTQEGWSMEEILVAAMGVYLMRMQAGEAFDLGWAVDDGTMYPDADLFAPIVPLRIRPDPEQSFFALLAASRHELAELQRKGTFASDLIARTPALRSRKALREGYQPSITIARPIPDLELTRKAGGVVFVLPESGDVGGVWFDRAGLEPAILRNLDVLGTLLESLAAHPEQPVGTAEMLSASARAEVLAMSSGPVLESGPDKPIHVLIAERAAQAPESVALEFRGEKFTYAQFDAATERLALRLKQEGIQPGDCVALLIARSSDAVVAMIGGLKAGACYLPLDPADPPGRITEILEEARPRLILTQLVLAELSASSAIPKMLLGKEDPEARNERVPPASPPSCGDGLACVIYTSGSSGKPKGVMIEHRSLTNYTHAAVRQFEITSADRVLQFSSLSFDACGEEIYPCLIQGATLVLRTEEMIKSGANFLRACSELAITVLDLPTAYWHHLVETMAHDNLRFPRSVRLLIIGGEAASPQVWAAWCTLENGIRVVNTYGPTEGTIVSTWCDLPQDSPAPTLPIGRPVPNTSAYILDGKEQLVPIGGVGELHLGGVNLARGYLHRPDASVAAFVKSPASTGIQETRLYRTGDRVRFRGDGNLEFLGRLDAQVKIRGFRVEPGEIEAVLREHPAMGRGVVIPKETEGVTVLWAFLEGEEGTLDFAALRVHLRQRLPSYMIPARWVALPALPLLSSGKIDRAMLQRWEGPTEQSLSPPAVCASPMEGELMRIWRDVLRCPSVGLRENFFDLGGHSLAAVAVNAQVARIFRVEVSMQWLLGEATIEALAREIDSLRPTRGRSKGAGINEEQQLIPVVEHVLASATPLHAYEDLSARLGEADKAEELARAIQRVFGVTFSHRALLGQATIAQMAEAVRAARSKTGLTRWTGLLQRHASEKVVALRTGSTADGLFICPGGWTRESELVVFAAMLPYWQSDLPVHGLKHDFAVRSSRVAASVEMAARNFVAQMVEVQPEGKIRLLAECISLAVGLEIAHQLAAAGRSVSQLVLLDPAKLERESLRRNAIYQKLPRKVLKYYRLLAGSALRPYAGDVLVICPDEPNEVRDRIRTWGTFQEEKLTVTQVRGDHHSYIRKYRADVARLIDQALFKDANDDRTTSRQAIFARHAVIQGQ